MKPAVTGNGFVDFYILTGSTDGVDYNSSEADKHRPTLVVSWSVPRVRFADPAVDAFADARSNAWADDGAGADAGAARADDGPDAWCVQHLPHLLRRQRVRERRQQR